MGAFLPKFLEVETPWVMWHSWPRGQRYQDNGQFQLHTLWLFLEGEAHVRMQHEEWVVRENSVCLMPPRRPREITTPKGAQWISVALRATLLGATDVLGLMRPPAIFQPEGQELASIREAGMGLHREWTGTSSPFTVTPERFDQYITEHHAASAQVDATSFLLQDAYARALIAHCWRHLGQVNLDLALGQGMPAWVPTVLQELRADPDISIDRLASDLGISSTQLRRQFQKWFAPSPREYLNRLRLEDARQYLSTTDLPVTEIAERIGFLSPPHFNRLFKQKYGMPPAQYRQLARIFRGR